MLGGTSNRLERCSVSAATANQIFECFLDLRVRWLGIPIKQLDRSENPAADAVTTLIDLLFDPGALNWVRLLGRTYTSQGRDLAAGD